MKVPTPRNTAKATIVATITGSISFEQLGDFRRI
jgi:hypothetical protein